MEYDRSIFGICGGREREELLGSEVLDREEKEGLENEVKIERDGALYDL